MHFQVNHTYTPDFRPLDMAFPFRFSAHPLAPFMLTEQN